jgi:predicted ATPase/DNA-binding SARP family transcriptional activator/transposase
MEPAGGIMDAPWRIELLGWLRVVQDDREVTRFRTQKTGSLLGYLAYYLHRSHPREALIESLWPDAEPRAARHCLSQALSSLRHQLEPPGVPPGTIIVADHHSIRLHPAACITDVGQFDAAMRAVVRAGSRIVRIQRLTEAVEHYRGELLPGFYEEWILTEREGLAERYSQTLAQLVTLLEQEGDLGRALEYARRAVSADLLCEEAHRALIRLLAATGQNDAALRQYQELERLLAQQLETVPAPETRAVAGEIKRHAEGELRRRTDWETTDLLSHRLLVLSRACPVAPPPLPTGTVIFLLAEFQGAGALAEAQDLLRPLWRAHGGHEGQGTGQTLQIAFGRASDALAAAVAGQRALEAHSWPSEGGAIRARMALHPGEVEPTGQFHRSPALHHATRLLLAAHPGQILLAEESAVLLRHDLPPGIHVVDLGLYRLGDQTPPGHLFQVVDGERAPHEFPPPNAPPGQTGNLPLQFTRFFGREPEINRLRELLAEPQRLVTLTGPGGSGKTRLALELAQRLRESLAGAVWFVPLQDLADPHRILGRARDALRLPRSPGVESMEQVAAALSQQPSLLLLDNLEHLLPEGAPLVQTLMERVPTLRCLVTSRHRLNLPGEREFPVPPLATPCGPASAEQLVRHDSVRLFVDRAQAVRPDFQVTAANAAAVSALCARLEGLPLALELAAARAGMLTPAQMVARLARRFELLVSRAHEADPRRRSLRATVDWSYRLLSPTLQRFFSQLSVFRGGWTLEAAEAICQGRSAEDASPVPGLALEYLFQLRECSLLLPEESGEEMRYCLLETLREYGAEQLTADERAALAQRHGQYYLALAQRAEPELRKADQPAWLERLAREQDNLRAALAWSVETGDAETGLRMTAALCRFWHVRCDVAEGRERLAQLLALPGAEARTAARARALHVAACLARDQNDLATARALLEEGLTLWRELGDGHGIAVSLSTLGHLLLHGREYDAARSLLDESLAIWRELGDQAGIANALNNLGIVARHQGGYRAARALHEESLALFQQLGDRHSISYALLDLGHLLVLQGDDDAARMTLEESLAITRELGNKRNAAAALDELGSVALRQGDTMTAQALAEKSLAIRRELGNKGGIVASLRQLWQAAVRQDNYEEARGHSQETLGITRELGDRRGVASSLHELGYVALCQDNYREAKAHYEESLAIMRELGFELSMGASLHGLGEVARHQRDYQVARLRYQEGLRIWRELRFQRGIAGCLEGLAKVARAEGEPVRAVRWFGAAASVRHTAGAPLPPNEQPQQEEQLAALRAALGEAAFTAVRAAAQALTWEQAAAEALGEDEPACEGPVPQLQASANGRGPDRPRLSARGDLTPQEWERIASLLPASAERRGRPYQEHRQVINGILWVLRTGAGWRDLPARYGAWHTCHNRFQRWQRQGIWDQIVQALQTPTDPVGQKDRASSTSERSRARARHHVGRVPQR